MTAMAKSAKSHPAAKKCCGWEEPAKCIKPCIEAACCLTSPPSARVAAMSETSMKYL